MSSFQRRWKLKISNLRLPSRGGIDERFVTPVCERRHEIQEQGPMAALHKDAPAWSRADLQPPLKLWLAGRVRHVRT